MPEAPKYRVLAPTFIAPHMIYPGSVITSNGKPGNHLEPLNQPAHEAMERWYNEEWENFDKDGKSLGMIKPHMQYRVKSQTPGDQADVVLISGPPKETKPLMSLAEAQFARADAAPAGPLTPTDEQPLEAFNPDTVIESATPNPTPIAKVG